MQFYCVKCRQREEGEDLQEVQMKNGKQAFKAFCPVCGSAMFKIGGIAYTHTFKDMDFITETMMSDLYISIKNNLWLY